MLWPGWHTRQQNDSNYLIMDWKKEEFGWNFWQDLNCGPLERSEVDQVATPSQMSKTSTQGTCRTLPGENTKEGEQQNSLSLFRWLNFSLAKRREGIGHVPDQARGKLVRIYFPHVSHVLVHFIHRKIQVDLKMLGQFSWKIYNGVGCHTTRSKLGKQTFLFSDKKNWGIIWT